MYATSFDGRHISFQSTTISPGVITHEDNGFVPLTNSLADSISRIEIIHTTVNMKQLKGRVNTGYGHEASRWQSHEGSRAGNTPRRLGLSPGGWPARPVGCVHRGISSLVH